MIWLLLYAFFLCFLAYYDQHTKSATNTEAFFVNNRQSSTLAVAFSIVASCVGGSATLGMAGLAWQVGTPAFWWLGSGALGLCILTFFLATKARQSNAYTLPEMIDTYLGAPSRPLASIIIILAWIAITSAQFSAMGAIIVPFIPEVIDALPTPLATSLLHIDHATLALLLGASIVIIYACIGGQAAIIKSDMVQYILLMLAIFVCIFLLFMQIHEGGLQNPLHMVEIEFVNEAFPLSKFSYFMLILGGSYVVCPMLFGRLYSAKNGQTAKRGAALAVVWLLFTAICIVLLGLISRAFISPELTTTAPEKVLTTVLFQHLPPWASILAFLGIFSAIISSADSSLITAATIASNDVLRKKSLAACRICTLGIGLSSILLALSGKGILHLLLMANDIYVCGVVAPVFVGMFLHNRCAIRPNIMAAAMAVGGGFGFSAALSGNHMYSYLGICAALCTAFASIKKPVPKPLT